MFEHELAAGQDEIVEVVYDPDPGWADLAFRPEGYRKPPIPQLRVHYLSGREQTFVGQQARELLRWAHRWSRYIDFRVVEPPRPHWCKWIRWRPGESRGPRQVTPAALV